MTTSWRSTGFPDADPRDDVTRARRSASWARVAARLRDRPGELAVLLPSDEVVGAPADRAQRKLDAAPERGCDAASTARTVSPGPGPT